MTNTQKQRILVLTGVFPPMQMAEGDHIARLCAELATRGYAIDVLTSVEGTPGLASGYHVHAAMRSWNWESQRRITRLLRRLRPDIVFIWYVGMAYAYHPMITFIPSQIKRILPGATIITQVTAPVGSEPLRFPRATRVLRKAAALMAGGRNIDFHYGTLLRDSDAVIAMAESHLQQLSQAFTELKSKASIVPPPPLIPMSPDTEASRQAGRKLLGVSQDAPLFAYFGRLYHGKGIEHLIDAFKRVVDERPDARLAIIGGPASPKPGEDWNPNSLRQRASSLGLDSAISWTGEFPFEGDVGSLYLRAADFAVLPFDWGAALNNSSIAACVSHGLPLITTRREPADPAFADKSTALLCPSRDPVALATAMLTLMYDKPLAARLRTGAEELRRVHFSWETSVDRTISAFNSAQTNRRGRNT